MEKTQFLYYAYIGGFVGAGIVSCWGALLAQRRNRPQGKWAFICFLTGLIGLFTLGCSKNLDVDKDGYIEEDDTLGNVMIVLAVIWTFIILFITYRFLNLIWK